MIQVSRRSNSIEYAIRDVVVEADKLEKQGHKILKLNIGDPNKYDFDTPEFIKEAYIEAIKFKDNGYSSSEGIKILREAIVKREQEFHNLDINSDKIIITSGVSEALLFLFGALVEEGDQILIPGPSYPPYISFVKYFGGIPVEYRTIEQENWQPDLKDIEEKINDKTKAIVIINPNNPTGALYSKEVIQEMIKIIKKNNLLLISDEIYDQLSFGEHISPCTFAENIPFVQLNGLSKAYLAPGWRIGNMNFSNNNENLYDACIKQARIRLCANHQAQFAYAKALNTKSDFIKEVRTKIQQRGEYAYKRLNEIKGLSATKPNGAFYIFPKIEDKRFQDDKKFVLDLLEKKKVLFVYGIGFGEEYGKGHFRSVVLPCLDILKEAFDKVEEFLKE
ncbi:MAG: aminotransferase class I/II-fold pyridoxal phosphate-dependent enzyme [bacterium]